MTDRQEFIKFCKDAKEGWGIPPETTAGAFRFMQVNNLEYLLASAKKDEEGNEVDVLPKFIIPVGAEEEAYKYLVEVGFIKVTETEDEDVVEGESLAEQVQRLAKFILDTVEGEASENEGAVDTAIRLLKIAHGPKVQEVDPNDHGTGVDGAGNPNPPQAEPGNDPEPEFENEADAPENDSPPPANDEVASQNE